MNEDEIKTPGGVILKPGHYVVHPNRTILRNPSSGMPQRFGGFGACKFVAEILGAATLTVTVSNYAWGE